MVAKNRKIDMRGLTVQVGALEIGDEAFADVDSITINGSDYKFTDTTYKATVTVANGATTGKETAIGMPANFIPRCVAVEVTVASTNAATLVDIGDDADTDSYCDGLATNDLTATGFKGVFGCNGVRGQGPGSTTTNGATTTADEVEVVVSADPGATGVTMELTFYGTLVEAV